jgi:hypothetical protein
VRERRTLLAVTRPASGGILKALDSSSATPSLRTASWSSKGIKEKGMTGKTDFTLAEWELVLGGPPTAGLIVVTAQRGGVFRETFEIGKAYAEARRLYGQSQLLDEIVGARYKRDHTRYRSAAEMKKGGLKHLRDAIALLEQKATPDELDAYKSFVLTVANRVANAHREEGVYVSAAEQAAIDEITAALGADE